MPRPSVWENKLISLSGNRMLNVAWTVEHAKQDLPVSLSEQNGGRSWSDPRSTGLIGQTTTPLHLGDDRLLCVYRRKDKLGLWAVLAHIDETAGGAWVTDSQWPIWGTKTLGDEHTEQGFKPEGMGEVFKVLSFGLPTLVQLDAATVLMAFWCEEEGITNIGHSNCTWVMRECFGFVDIYIYIRIYTLVRCR